MKIDWQKRAEDALGITRRQESGHYDSGTYLEMNGLRSQVTAIAAALAEAYGEGKADGRAEARRNA